MVEFEINWHSWGSPSFYKVGIYSFRVLGDEWWMKFDLIPKNNCWSRNNMLLYNFWLLKGCSVFFIPRECLNVYWLLQFVKIIKISLIDIRNGSNLLGKYIPHFLIYFLLTTIIIDINNYNSYWVNLLYHVIVYLGANFSCDN